MPLLLLLSGGVYSLSSLSRAISLVQHSGEVQLVLSQLLSSLVDAETGQRGYLVDGERRFLEPYERALSTWHAEMARLRALTQDNPDQQQRLDRLGRLIDKQLEELRATMAARDSGARGSDLDARMAAGKETMDDIRRVVSEMEEEERRLGHERQQAAASRWRWTLLVFFGGAFAFVSIAGAVWIQRRGAKARERLAAERERSIQFAEQFIGILGHDLRNPLNAITMTAKLLKLQGDGNQKSLDRILSSAQRMSTMVTQLLDLTRSRLAGGIPVERKQAELGAVISGIVDELRAAQPGRVIRWEAPGEILGAWDAERLGQVVSNLVGNALEYGDPERPIDVQLAAGGDLATFSVHSHGAPIAPELLPVLFEPYRRGDARNARSKGLGLGLFITQQIVHAHEGRVEVRSTAEEGTTFTVTLPRGSRTREVVSTVGPPVS